MKDDGGPAFPIHDHYGKADSIGMSLRDYFAAMALQGSLADGGGSYEQEAKWAYAYADAMLAERAK